MLDTSRVVGLALAVLVASSFLGPRAHAGWQNSTLLGPLAALAGPAVLALNKVIEAEASAFGAHYVDTYTPFLGHEAQYTYIGQLDVSGAPNVHPNATGYGVIAAQIEAVPEPGSLFVFGGGLIGLIVFHRQRRKAASRQLSPKARPYQRGREHVVR